MIKSKDKYHKENHNHMKDKKKKSFDECKDNLKIINTNIKLKIKNNNQIFYFDSQNRPLTIILSNPKIKWKCKFPITIYLILLFKKSNIVTIETDPLFGAFDLTPTNSKRTLIFFNNSWKIISNVNDSFFPTRQQCEKLVGIDEKCGNIEIDLQGFSVFLSNDGNILAVGSPNNNNFIGAVWIFKRENSIWYQENKLIGSGIIGISSKQGSSVALSSDGKTLAIGGIDDDNNIGATWIFENFNGVWKEQAKLVGSGNIGKSLQGTSVSLTSDGNIIAIGGIGDNNNIGATWIFYRTNGIWNQIIKLIGSDYFGQSKQGTSVSLSATGNFLAIGGIGDNYLIGAVWIFTFKNGIWCQLCSKIVPFDSIDTSIIGSSVSLSADGYTLAFGGQGDNTVTGAVWIYIFNGIEFIEQSKLIGSANIGLAQQGCSVSLSSDGNTVAFGGKIDNCNIGATWIFTRSKNDWIQKGYTLVGNDFIGSPTQGTSVCLSANGTTLAIGGPFDNSCIGATWIFT